MAQQTPTELAAPLAALPFVKHFPRSRQARIHYWQIPPSDDYAQACTVGRDYAKLFVQLLAQHPAWIGVNLLGCIAADIDYRDESPNRGYWVGFFTYLEGCLVFGENGAPGM